MIKFIIQFFKCFSTAWKETKRLEKQIEEFKQMYDVVECSDDNGNPAYKVIRKE